MTLNNVVNRVKTIAQSHNQVRSFGSGQLSDFLANHTTKYPAVFLQDIGGSISTGRKDTTINYKLVLVDLVHTVEDTKDNELDVMSDMVSIAMDLIAQLHAPFFNDWKVSADSNMQFVKGDEGDMYAGVIVDFSVSFMFSQNRCQIPSDFFDQTKTFDLMFDKTYIATGLEGSTLTTDGATPNIPEINNKKILLITREFSPIYKSTGVPQASEYTWNNKTIGLGSPTNVGERFLILYRNY